MTNNSKTFEAVTSSMLRVLKEDLHRKDGTLESYSGKWNRVKRFMEGHNLRYLTPDICDNFLLSIYGTKELSLLSGEDKKLVSAILLLKHFLLTGRIIPRKAPINFDGEIGKLMMQYVSYRKLERLSQHTIYNQEQLLSRFLQFLHSKNITSINAINEVHIIKYLSVIGIKYKSVASLSIYILRNFFRYLYQHKYINTDLAAFIPRDNYKKQGKLPSTYNGEEVKKLLSSIDRSTAVGKRNYSILLLAAILGLRASDIANLKFENVSWENSNLSITQFKTGKELELPLLPEIGNAIIEYLRYGRPKSDLPYIFLLANSPFTKTSQSVITQIARKAFKQAKIDTSNKHHGAHAFRHSLATLLLEDSVKLPVISEILGHENTESTRYYLRVDLQTLRKCALDVPFTSKDFYNQKGGYFYA
ncbi:MAG TPA: site-specific integrase [Arachidicoccus soli]|nr:site-specific integrase [Arachidicoccus soli]